MVNKGEGCFPFAQLCIYSGYVIKRPEITESGRLGEKVDSGVKFCYAVCNKRSIKVVNIDRIGTKEGL